MKRRARWRSSCKPIVSPAWGTLGLPRSAFNSTGLYDALITARVIGDDHLQTAAGKFVDASLFTHGSSDSGNLG